MAEVIVMPKLSDTMEEGVLATWLKKEGDSVEEGDILAEIETDKATMEYESPVDGKILKLVIKPGTKVNLGQPIAIVGDEGETFDKSMLEDGAPSEQVTKQDHAAAPAQAPTAPAPTSESASQPTARAATHVPPTNHGRVKASPLARKLAADKGVDISLVNGSGPGGRIVMKDIEGLRPGGIGAPAQPTRGGEDRVVPASMMRQTIAKRLHAAKNDAPHFYLTRSIDMAATLAWRQKLNAEVAKDDSLPKVSVNDCIMMACAKALRKHPDVNASWQGESIKQFGAVHIAMAVALPTGLITPVIRHCDQIGIRDIARTSRELAVQAKKGQLKPEDYTGGTFTVSNLGMLGIEEFTAIINPPQAAILAIGATVPTPWVDNKGEIVVAQRMKVTMSCDHRAIDGAVGAQFLQTFVTYLEDPLMMLA